MRRTVLILLCAIMCSCQAFRITEILDNAERQLAVAPDSALMTMRSVHKCAVLIPKHRARYGVLYSAALDKNYINVASDSLIRYSADYYDLKGTPKERMRAYYYLGRTQQNAADYQAAILSFLDAAQYTDVVEDNYLRGLLYSNLGLVYSDCHHNEVAFEYAARSYNYYKQADLKEHQAYQLYHMGRILNYTTPYTQGFDYLKQALELSTEIGFDKGLLMSYRQLVLGYTHLGLYDNAYYYWWWGYKKFGEQLHSNSGICGAAAVVLSYKGLHKRAKKLLDKGHQMVDSPEASIMMHYYNSFINNLGGECEQATEDLITGQLEHIAHLTNIVNTNLSDVELKYFENKAALLEQREEQQKRTFVWVVVLLAVVAVAIVLFRHIYAKNRERALRREIDNYVAIIEDIRRDFAHLNIEKSAKIVVEQELAIFDQLCVSYYTYDDDKKQQIDLYNRVKSLIEKFSSDAETLAKIERDIDLRHDGAMGKLRAELANLNATEYRLACYIFAGFSNQAISVFMQSESGAVATRKSRLKSKIIKANPPSLHLFVAMF